MGTPVVAIVDDDPRVLASLDELLESAGYATISFASAEALLAHGLEGVDILITDIGMQGADGFELRDRVWRKYPELPVFLITGRHEITDQSHSCGKGGFLRKPFDGHALLAALRGALDDKQA
ncbi:response regulator [Mycoplana rhizolycopersici]|uniref:Response regulator n=1 Tax=Mycoplana rhizolycopersici TaxID=2746702 RepID=A0ABX2QKK7_9HYPH|nr:response regulator [Rhizobium rhizolycopersici]NVP58314.1 response regulator [Rhizobium rhizolycopersici]